MQDSTRVQLEIYVPAMGWVTAAEIKLDGPEILGHACPIKFAYEIDYALHETPQKPAVSLQIPVTTQIMQFKGWPPFMFDLVPSGAARRFWMKKLGLGEGPHADWKIFSEGAFNPPGRVRVKRPMIPEQVNLNPSGFVLDDVVDRSQEFLYYIEEFGGPVKGATGAGGDAPKYLLREDQYGRFHADLALQDKETKGCWLVKFPRGAVSSSDIEVLKGEFQYYSLARELNLGTFDQAPKLARSDDKIALFIPRIDRSVAVNFEYFGLESLYSANGICGWPYSTDHAQLLNAFAVYSTKPVEDFVRYVKRDLANLIFGNTDNHGRNTAFLIDGTGARLSPIFDFAPMFIDREGILRSIRWGCEKAGALDINDLIIETAQRFSLETSHRKNSNLDSINQSQLEKRIKDELAQFLSQSKLSMEKLLDEIDECPILQKKLETTSVPFLQQLCSQL